MSCEFADTHRRYLPRRRPEQVAQTGTRAGPSPESIAPAVIPHVMVTHVVVESITYMTEVNARHPDAVDRHVRRAQWSHWCGEKCRSTTRHMCVVCLCNVSPVAFDIYIPDPYAPQVAGALQGRATLQRHPAVPRPLSPCATHVYYPLRCVYVAHSRCVAHVHTDNMTSIHAPTGRGGSAGGGTAVCTTAPAVCMHGTFAFPACLIMFCMDLFRRLYECVPYT